MTTNCYQPCACSACSAWPRFGSVQSRQTSVVERTANMILAIFQAALCHWAPDSDPSCSLAALATLDDPSASTNSELAVSLVLR